MTILDPALRRVSDDPDGIAVCLHGRRHRTTLTHRALVAGPAPPGWVIKATSGKISRVANRAKSMGTKRPHGG